jgi:hypothetical protein
VHKLLAKKYGFELARLYLSLDFVGCNKFVLVGCNTFLVASQLGILIRIVISLH